MGLVEQCPGSLISSLAASAIARWFAVYTYPRHEKAVAEQLKFKDVEVFLPTFTIVNRWKDRRVAITNPVFPGYLFARIQLNERITIISTPSVIRILSHNGVPAPVSDQEIEAVRLCLTAGGSVERHPFLQAGERVRVRSGAFEGVEGIVVRRKNQCKLVVSIGAIHQSVALEIEADELERIKPSRGLHPSGQQLAIS
jgi:transcription antitermination factor NusG